MVIKYLLKFFLILFFFISNNHSRADFFQDITSQIEDNDFRLSYGISVTDVNQDNKYEFVVTGFGFSNLALTYQNEKLVNINKNEIFDDAERKSIGVAACDIDQDGFEEIYFLNTDTYSGEKQYSDRLIDNSSNGFVDLFEKDINKKNLNLTAGRSVVCVDRNGDGKYGIYVANYGGPTRFYELRTGQILDLAEQLKINKITGGRAVVAGNILSGKTDIFAANERGKNFLYYNLMDIFRILLKIIKLMINMKMEEVQL
tara:strand:+ start:602 stop:1375 length:774 start_codon:yes stop_codon:yes gene_type:complete